MWFIQVCGFGSHRKVVWTILFGLKVLNNLIYRPGGRIHSCWLGDVVAEMGCSHIYGACIGNPVFNLAAQEGLLKPPLKRIDPSKGCLHSF